MPLSYIAHVQMGIRGLTWWHPDVGVRPATLPPVPSPADEAMRTGWVVGAHLYAAVSV